MREIKFRAWDKEQEKMYYVPAIYFSLKVAALGMGKDSIEVGFDNVELMQYTGLKDKNGKEIYEGDIVEWFTKGNEKERAQVSWWSYPGHWGWWPNNIYSMEVIGNIYENPELLK